MHSNSMKPGIDSWVTPPALGSRDKRGSWKFSDWPVSGSLRYCFKEIRQREERKTSAAFLWPPYVYMHTCTLTCMYHTHSRACIMHTHMHVPCIHACTIYTQCMHMPHTLTCMNYAYSHARTMYTCMYHIHSHACATNTYMHTP